MTPKGKRDVQDVLSAAKDAMTAPEAILTSPLARAQQTAAIALKAFPFAKLVETQALLPAANPEQLWKEIGALRATGAVIVAGHEPHLSNFIRYLLEAAVAIDLKKGAMVRIETKNPMGAPRGSLKWMITPRLARGKRRG